MFHEFVTEWGYLAILIGTFFEGETVLIAGGAMAHRGLLELPFVILAAFSGCVVGDTVWFLSGRRFGRPYIDSRPRLKDRAERVRVWANRYGVAFILSFRFIYGIRTITPAVLGAMGYPAKKYLLLNLISGAVWAVAFGFIGFGLGAGLFNLIQRFGHTYELIAAAIVFSGLAWFLWRRLKRRAHRPDMPELP